MWAFERLGVVPDFVTLGKPTGNGHPVAALTTREEIVRALAGHTTLFSTFGGRPVSAAAALPVLDVIEDERGARVHLGRRRAHSEALSPPSLLQIEPANRWLSTMRPMAARPWP